MERELILPAMPFLLDILRLYSLKALCVLFFLEVGHVWFWSDVRIAFPDYFPNSFKHRQDFRRCIQMISALPNTVDCECEPHMSESNVQDNDLKRSREKSSQAGMGRYV